MKRTLLLLLALLGLSLSAQNANDMVLEYEITSPNTTISLPLAGTVNVTVNWGDGQIESFTTGGIKRHSYATTGIYNVNISGSLTAYGSELAINNNLTKVKSFGNLGITSLYCAFYYASNLVEAPTTLPSTVTNLSYMFSNCSKFNSDITLWDTQNVTNMSGMFRSATSFNQRIGSWNTQNVTYMSSMFSGASTFNQPIGSWNTINVTDMGFMFAYSSSFSQPIGSWNTINVTDMDFMFAYTSSFNQPIGSWNTQNVKSMNDMFAFALSFNQPIGAWKIGKVETLRKKDGFLYGTNISSENYENILIGWAKQELKSNLGLDASSTKYSSCEAQIARQKLIDTFKWNIKDGGLAGTACVVTDMNDTKVQESLLAYPSPTKDYLHIDLLDGSKVELFSQQGQVFQLETQNQQINVGALPKGMYLLKTATAKQKVVLE